MSVHDGGHRLPLPIPVLDNKQGYQSLEKALQSSKEEGRKGSKASTLSTRSRGRSRAGSEESTISLSPTERSLRCSNASTVGQSSTRSRSLSPYYTLWSGARAEGAAARRAVLMELQNEFIRKGIERDKKLNIAADVRRKSKEVHDRRIMDKMENDKAKVRRKLAQQACRALLAYKQNKAKQERVMQHNQEEAASLLSAREKLVHEEQNREELIRQRKNQQEEVLLSRGMQRERKLQEAANQRARSRDLLLKRLANKHAAEEATIERRLEVALAARKSLGRAHSCQEVASRGGTAWNRGRRRSRSVADLAQSMNEFVETQQVEMPKTESAKSSLLACLGPFDSDVHATVEKLERSKHNTFEEPIAETLQGG